MTSLRFTPDAVVEFGHPSSHDYLCPAQITTVLDGAAVLSKAHGNHAWDYATNLAAIVVDTDSGTITFILKGNVEDRQRIDPYDAAALGRSL